MAEQRNQTPAGDNTQWTTIIRPRTGWFDVDLEELWRYRDLIVMFVKRNFTVMYKQTILGPLWIILNPLITTVLFNVVFGILATGILFLPFEGLYAEVVSSGVTELLQRDYQITVAGPSTMAALLNALQMGFRTLAIQKRSGEVWQILGAVKTEFEKFGSGLQSMQRHLNQTGSDLEELIGPRSRAITRKLESVQQLDPDTATGLLGIEE